MKERKTWSLARQKITDDHNIGQITDSIPFSGISAIIRLGIKGYSTAFDLTKEVIGYEFHEEIVHKRMNYPISHKVIKELRNLGIIEIMGHEDLGKNKFLAKKYHGFTRFGLVIALSCNDLLTNTEPPREWMNFINGLKSTYKHKLPRCLSLFTDELINDPFYGQAVLEFSTSVARAISKVYYNEISQINDDDFDNLLLKMIVKDYLSHFFKIGYLDLNDDFMRELFEPFNSNKYILSIIKEIIKETKMEIEFVQRNLKVLKQIDEHLNKNSQS